MALLRRRHDRQDDEEQTRRLGVVEEAEEPCDGEAREDDGLRGRREDGVRRPHAFVIAEEASYHEGEHGEAERRREAQHGEVAFKHEDLLEDDAQHVTARVRSGGHDGT